MSIQTPIDPTGPPAGILHHTQEWAGPFSLPLPVETMSMKQSDLHCIAPVPAPASQVSQPTTSIPRFGKVLPSRGTAVNHAAELRGVSGRKASQEVYKT